MFSTQGEKDTDGGKHPGHFVWRRSLKLDPPTVFTHTYCMSPVIHPTCKLAAHSTEGHSESLIQSYKEAQENLTHTHTHSSQNSLLCTSWDHVTKMQHFLSLLQNLLFPESFPWVHEEIWHRNKHCFIQKLLPTCTLELLSYLSVKGKNIVQRCLSRGWRKTAENFVKVFKRGQQKFGRSFY